MKIYIGKTECGDHVLAEIDTKTNLIKGFDSGNEYEDIHSNELEVNHTGWTHKEVIKGKTFKTGDACPKPADIPNGLDQLSDGYLNSTISCEECGGEADSEMEHYPDFPIRVISDGHGCSAICTECITADHIMVPVNTPTDVFKAKNATDINTDGYTEIDTLFCDSSGLGNSSEPASTKSKTELKVAVLLNKHSQQLYAAITDIGQFQVYLTLFIKD